jgi:hypothetical protein
VHSGTPIGAGAVDKYSDPKSKIKHGVEVAVADCLSSFINSLTGLFREKVKMDTDIAELKKEVSLLRKEVSRVSDEAEVRKVHFKYGYYLDKCLYNEVRSHPFALISSHGELSLVNNH